MANILWCSRRQAQTLAHNCRISDEFAILDKAGQITHFDELKAEKTVGQLRLNLILPATGDSLSWCYRSPVKSRIGRSSDFDLWIERYKLLNNRSKRVRVDRKKKRAEIVFLAIVIN